MQKKRMNYSVKDFLDISAATASDTEQSSDDDAECKYISCHNLLLLFNTHLPYISLSTWWWHSPGSNGTSIAYQPKCRIPEPWNWRSPEIGIRIPSARLGFVSSRHCFSNRTRHRIQRILREYKSQLALRTSQTENVYDSCQGNTCLLLNLPFPFHT